MSVESSKIDINRIFSGDTSGGAALTPEFSPPPPVAEHGEIPRSTMIPAEGEGDHGLIRNNVDVNGGDFSPVTDMSGEFLHDVDVDVDKGFLDCYFETDSVYPVENRINSVSILNLIDGTFRKTDFSDSDAPGFVRGAYTVEEGKKSNPNSQNSNLGHRIEASSDLTPDKSISPVQTRAKIASISDAIDDLFKNSDTNKSGSDLGFSVGNNETITVDDGGDISISAILTPDKLISPVQTRAKIASISDAIDDIFKNSDTNKSGSDLGLSVGNNETITVDDGGDISISAMDSPGGGDHPPNLPDNSPCCENTSHDSREVEEPGASPADDFPSHLPDPSLKRKQSSYDKGKRKTEKKKNGRVSEAMAKGSPSMVRTRGKAAVRRCYGLTEPADHSVKDGYTPDEFQISDIVWGKVQSHPWWPGQIFDPSSSSNMARTHYKGDGFLIAYFGDHTFAWNHPSHIKPFREWFARFEPKSATDSFRRAVDCAVEEVSRRARVGLSCLCLPKEAYDRVGSQVVINAGIREESSRREGGDRFSSPSSFDPLKLVRFMKSASASPLRLADRLELAVFRAQLLAFCQHRSPRTGVRLGLPGAGRMRPSPVAFEADPARPPRVGERLCKAISKLSGSDPILKKRERDRVEESGKGKRRLVAVEDGSIGGRLSQLRSAARDPLGGGGGRGVTGSTARFFSEFRNARAVAPAGSDGAGPECGQDSYWTDRVVQSIPEECSSPEEDREEPKKTGSGRDLVKDEGGDATALVLIFSDPGSVPSEADLNEIFSRHGPLNGSGTKVTKKSSRAKVVFERRPDAEAAFSSTGKFGIFGPSLVSYRLRYLRKPCSRKKTKGGR